MVSPVVFQFLQWQAVVRLSICALVVVEELRIWCSSPRLSAG
jgi:hypothetical protein